MEKILIMYMIGMENIKIPVTILNNTTEKMNQG